VTFHGPAGGGVLFIGASASGVADPLAAFTGEVVDAVAADEGIESDALRELIRRQQRLVREFPDMTVEALVHDWRKAFPEDPLVRTDATAYYLSVRPGVWSDVVGRLDLTAAEREALRIVNARQFEETRGEPAEKTAVVLTR
jgi:hypothetical protein